METKKKYLETIEEAKTALDAGKILYVENTGVQITKSENSTFFYEDKINWKRFNSKSLFLPVLDKLYTLESETLEVKLWHLYKTNNGNIIFIISDKGKGLVDHYFLGLDIKEQDLLHFYECGTSEGEDDGWDLVEEIADLSEYFNKENNKNKC